jgi:hypothetical protein
MANTEPDAGLRGDSAYRGEGQRSSGAVRGRSGQPPGRRGIFIDTEARHGFITTEFWLTILGVIALVIMAYNSDLLGVRWGVGMATAVLVAYILSRGIAKAGSSEVVRRDSDDF